MKIDLKYIGLALLFSSLVACSSIRTIIADFDLNGTATILGEDGAVHESAKLSKLERGPKRASPFGDLHYEGELFSATLTIDSDSVHGVFINKTASAMQLRFDQASLSSNFQREEIGLQAFMARIQRNMVRGTKGELVKVPPMSLQPGERGNLTIVPSYANLFPSRRLFGVQFDGKQPVLTATGVGNSIRLRVPVEYENRRVYLVFELTASQTSARSSYR